MHYTKLIYLVVFLPGCTMHASSQSYHMYSAPMLERTPAHRTRQKQQQAAFAQRQTQHHTQNIKYAQNKISNTNTHATGSRKARRKKTTTPTLSSNRRVSMPSKRSKQHATTDTLNATQSKFAAQYVWDTLKTHHKLPIKTKSNITHLFQHCKKRGKLSFKHTKPGDLVFFHNTTDTNEDGRNNDWYTLVGLAESIDDETIVIVAYQHHKVHRITMNLKYPTAAWHHGQRINTQLRKRKKRDLPFTQYMAGQLYAGSCAFLPRASILPNLSWRP